jgi:hypothetical protein
MLCPEGVSRNQTLKSKGKNDNATIYNREMDFLGAKQAFRLPFEGADRVLCVFLRLDGVGGKLRLEVGTMERLVLKGKFNGFAEVWA